MVERTCAIVVPDRADGWQAHLAAACQLATSLVRGGRRVIEVRTGTPTLDLGLPAVEVRGAVPVGPAVLEPGAHLLDAIRAVGDAVVVLLDTGGVGWALVTARAQGLLQGDVRVVVHAVGPSARRRAEAGRWAASFVDAVVDRLEDEVLAHADEVVPTSAAVADWLVAHGPATAVRGEPSRTGSTPDVDLLAAVEGLLEGAAPREPSAPGGDGGRPAVTAVVTHYERPAFARRAVDSLLGQSWADLRLLVVDDGSTSAAAMEFLGELDRRALSRPLRVIRQDNRGLGAARNAALRAAETDYVAFLDDDDEAEPDYVTRLVTAALHTGAAAAVAGFAVHRDVPFGPLVPGDEQQHWLFFSPAADLAALDNIVGGAAALFRRATALEVGGFHERRGVAYEDWHLLVRLALAGHLVTAVPEPLVRYRVYAGSMLQTFSRWASHQAVLEAFADVLPAPLRRWPTIQLGLHAEVEEARAQVGSCRQAMGALEARARADADELDRLRVAAAHRDALLGSTTWRVGRAVVGPAERFRQRLPAALVARLRRG